MRVASVTLLAVCGVVIFDTCYGFPVTQLLSSTSAATSAFNTETYTTAVNNVNNADYVDVVDNAAFAQSLNYDAANANLALQHEIYENQIEQMNDAAEQAAIENFLLNTDGIYDMSDDLSGSSNSSSDSSLSVSDSSVIDV